MSSPTGRRRLSAASNDDPREMEVFDFPFRLPEPLHRRKPVRMCFRFSLLLGNALYCALGLILIISGSYYINAADQNGLPLSLVPIGIVAVGIIMEFLAVLGFFSTIYEKRKLLHVVFLMVLLVVIFQIVIVAMAANELNSVPSITQSFWSSSPPSVIDRVQQAFSCCGYSNHTDAPGPSCKDKVPEGWSDGCYDTVVNYVHQHAGSIEIVLIVVMVIQAMALILTITLARLIPSRREREALELEEAWLRTLGEATERELGDVDNNAFGNEEQRRLLIDEVYVR